LQHNLFLLTYNDQLGLAPPNDPKSKDNRVLDVGTGTGIWVIDYADEHPQAEVIGVDLSPIQPSLYGSSCTLCSPNARFEIDDIDEEWNYSEPFDYIHSRMMNSSIADWEVYFQKMYSNLVPGGYVEVQEIEVPLKSDDETLKKDHQLFKWCQLLREGTMKLQRPFESFDAIKKAMAKAGFIEIVDTRFKWPTNCWPKDRKYKELGAWNNKNTLQALEALTLAPFTRVHGWTKDEVHVFLPGVRRDLNDQNIHAYWPICSIYGMKPKDGL
ncbi:S-adenosyl-L-methionine-dependent methyltransferase, partial [Dactylonectria estremocensis]